MLRSIQEELLCVLWAILALLLFRCGHPVLGFFALLKFVECLLAAWFFAIKNGLAHMKKFKSYIKQDKP